MIKYNSTRDEQQLYSEGFCHVLAIAWAELNQEMRFLVIRSKSETYESDDGETFPSVVHVYVVDSNNVAYDIFGERPINEVIDECKRRWFDDDIYISSIRERFELDELISYTNDHGYNDRPLDSFVDSDLEEAKSTINRILSYKPKNIALTI